jgi:hypothetical protein
VKRVAGRQHDAHQGPFCAACQLKLERAASPAIGNVLAVPASVKTLVFIIRPPFFPPLNSANESPRAPPVG